VGLVDLILGAENGTIYAFFTRSRARAGGGTDLGGGSVVWE
jgi:hypothetical protein